MRIFTQRVASERVVADEFGYGWPGVLWGYSRRTQGYVPAATVVRVDGRRNGTIDATGRLITKGGREHESSGQSPMSGSEESVARALSQERRETARALRRRLVAHIAAGCTTDMASETLVNDRAAYVDRERLEREREVLFFGTPLLAGLSNEVAAPGDCLVFDELGPSVVIVRGRDRRLRAFLNMCTHRGSKLVVPGADGRCTRRRRLTCPFHAWSFDLEGKLAGIPGREGFDETVLRGRDLVPVGVAEQEGMIFVDLSSRCDEDVDAHLGALVPELRRLGLGRLRPLRSSRLTAQTDWKLALDTYCEGYHFGVLHRSTIGLSHHTNVGTFDDFAPHWRLCFAARALDALVAEPEASWPEPTYSSVYFLFPNAILVASELAEDELCVRIFRLFPGAAPGAMSCRIDVYVSPEISADTARLARDFAHDDATSKITEEDYLVAEQAYRNLAAAPDGFQVVYGRNEPAVQAFHRAVAARIDAPEVTTGTEGATVRSARVS